MVSNLNFILSKFNSTKVVRANHPTVHLYRVLFCGEATHGDSYGTMHGARQTGLREAGRIIKLLKDAEKSVQVEEGEEEKRRREEEEKKKAEEQYDQFIQSIAQ